MNHCNTCCWWGHGQSGPFSTYVRWKGSVEAPVKLCGNPKLVNIDAADDGYLAVPEDGFGLNYPVCDLVTGPAFGCVLHEPKEEANEPCPQGQA